MEPNQPLVTPQEPIQQPIPVSNSIKPLTILIFVLLGILILGSVGSAAYFLSKSQTTKQVPTASASPTPTPIANNAGTGCRIDGCSSEICRNEESESIYSACVYLSKFACYKTAKCEKQADRKCGWTATNELTSCLNNFQKNDLKKEILKYPKIEQNLIQLINSSDRSAFADSSNLKLQGDRVQIDIKVSDTNYEIDPKFGLEQTRYADTIEAYIIIDKIIDLSNDSKIIYIKTPNYAVPL